MPIREASPVLMVFSPLMHAQHRGWGQTFILPSYRTSVWKHKEQSVRACRHLCLRAEAVCRRSSLGQGLCPGLSGAARDLADAGQDTSSGLTSHRISPLQKIRKANAVRHPAAPSKCCAPMPSEWIHSRVPAAQHRQRGRWEGRRGKQIRGRDRENQGRGEHPS